MEQEPLYCPGWPAPHVVPGTSQDSPFINLPVEGAASFSLEFPLTRQAALFLPQHPPEKVSAHIPDGTRAFLQITFSNHSLHPFSIQCLTFPQVSKARDKFLPTSSPLFEVNFQILLQGIYFPICMF